MLNSPIAEPATVAHRRSPGAIALFLGVGFTAVFLLPYFFPVTPSISVSYLVGFNNQACLLLFIAFFGAFAWWSNGLGLLPPTSQPEPHPRGAGLSRTSLYAALLAYAAAMAAEWIFVRPRFATEEAIYFLDRLQHLARGQKIYLDFEFAYGPLLLYPPLLLSKYLHLSLAGGYYAAWLIEFLLGVLLLWQIVARLPLPPHLRTPIFVITALTWWAGILNFGLNSTPARFALAPFLCLLVLPYFSTPTSALRGVLYALASEFLLLLVSPEQAVAFAAATVLYLFLFGRPGRRRSSSLLLLFVAGSGSLLLLAQHAGSFRTLRMMGGGGFNFPLLPALQQIPIFALTLVAVCALINSLRHNSPQSRHARGGAAQYLTLLSLCLLPEAFGRSDVGHLLVSSTGFLFAAWVVLAPHPHVIKRTITAYLMLLIVVPAPISLFRFVLTQRRNPPSAPLMSPLSGSPATRPILAPLGRPIPNLDTLGPHTVDTGFYNAFDNVAQPIQIQQKLDELRREPEKDLLLPGSFTCHFNLASRSFRFVLMTPFVPPVRHTTDIYMPLCDYIQTHYRPSLTIASPLPGYRIWSPIPSETSSIDQPPSPQAAKLNRTRLADSVIRPQCSPAAFVPHPASAERPLTAEGDHTYGKPSRPAPPSPPDTAAPQSPPSQTVPHTRLPGQGSAREQNSGT